MSSRKKGKGKRSTGPDMSSEQQSKTTKGDASSNGGDAVGKEKGKGKEEGEGGVDVEGRAGGLKAFVQQMEGSSYRVVEMRLALVGAFGVAFRILLFDDLKDQDQTSTSVVSFVAIGLVVLIFSTWLDYFPSRLSHLQLRDAKGQGMSFGCLLLPTLCCAGIHCALYSAPEVVGLLTLYLVILCSLALLTVISSLLYSIPAPNNVTVYNFVAVALTFALYYWMNAPPWLVLPCIASYSVLVPWLLHTFPNSFTICEAMVMGQGLTLLLCDTVLQLLVISELVVLPDVFSVHRHESLLYVEFLLLGVLLCCALLSPALYKISQAKTHYDRKFWSGTFILLSLSVGVLLVLRWLQTALGGHHPIALVLIQTFTQPLHLGLMLYWLVITIVTVTIVAAQSSQSPWLAPLKANRPSSLWMRKWFHLFALLVYLPGLALAPDFLALGASLITFLTAVLELLRYFRMWPGGEGLHACLLPLLDSKDLGSLLLSHIYLLLGFSLPLWLTPLRDYTFMTKLGMYSGVLSLGVGDSMAAVAGQLMGKTKWPGTEKTTEGTMMSVLTQLLAVLVIILVDHHLPFPSLREWGIITGSVIATAILEAYTWQIDNLVLGLFQLAFFISFL